MSNVRSAPKADGPRSRSPAGSTTGRRWTRDGSLSIVVGTVAALAAASGLVALLESRTRASPTPRRSILLAVVAVAVSFGRTRDRHRDRRVPGLRLPVHRAALHAHGQRPAGVAQPRSCCWSSAWSWVGSLAVARPGATRRGPGSARPGRCSTDQLHARQRGVRRPRRCRRSPTAREDEVADDARLGRARRRRRGRHRGRRADRRRTPVVSRVLRRRPGDEPAEWVRVHAPQRGTKTAPGSGRASYRVAITAGGRTFGRLCG